MWLEHGVHLVSYVYAHSTKLAFVVTSSGKKWIVAKKNTVGMASGWSEADFLDETSDQSAKSKSEAEESKEPPESEDGEEEVSEEDKESEEKEASEEEDLDIITEKQVTKATTLVNKDKEAIVPKKTATKEKPAHKKRTQVDKESEDRFWNKKKRQSKCATCGETTKSKTCLCDKRCCKPCRKVCKRKMANKIAAIALARKMEAANERLPEKKRVRLEEDPEKPKKKVRFEASANKKHKSNSEDDEKTQDDDEEEEEASKEVEKGKTRVATIDSALPIHEAEEIIERKK